MVARVLGHLAELGDDRVRRGVRRVAHRHVDNVDAVAALLVLETVNAAEEVRWQLVHALAELDRIVDHGASIARSCPTLKISPSGRRGPPFLRVIRFESPCAGILA